MVAAMKNLYREAEISQYLTMVSGAGGTFLGFQDRHPIYALLMACGFFYFSTNYISLLVVMFFRFITTGEIRNRSEFYEPFVQGLTNTSVEQVGFVSFHHIVYIVLYMSCTIAFVTY